MTIIECVNEKTALNLNPFQVFVFLNEKTKRFEKRLRLLADRQRSFHFVFVDDARDEVIRELKEMGFDTERTIGIYPGSSWTIVDSEDVLGVNLNIKPKR